MMAIEDRYKATCMFFHLMSAIGRERENSARILPL